MELTSEQLLMAAFVVSSGLNVFMLFRVYNAIPREVLEALIDFGVRRAAETPSTMDDEAMDILQKIADAVVPVNIKKDEPTGLQG